MNTAERRLELGRRLRLLRGGMSLKDVEVASGGQYKAVVVGSWERGSRNMTVVALAGIAEFYHVDPADLIPSSHRRRLSLDDRLAIGQARELLQRVLQDDPEVIPS